jgi:hypothetical protein
LGIPDSDSLNTEIALLEHRFSDATPDEYHSFLIETQGLVEQMQKDLFGPQWNEGDREILEKVYENKIFRINNLTDSLVDLLYTKD